MLRPCRPYLRNNSPVIGEFLESHDRYVADLEPQGRQLEQADEEELNRRCVVLALFEQLFRIGPFFDTWLNRAPLDPLSIPEPAWILDLCRMSETFYVAMSERLAERHHLNPVFEGSIDVGGADADLIVDRTLSTSRRQRTRPMA